MPFVAQNSHALETANMGWAQGKDPNRFIVSKFGANPSVGNGTEEDIWGVGGSFAWPTTAQTVRVKAGGNAADDAAGAGARTVTIEGLNQDFVVTTETLTLAGASASSASTTTFFRVYRAFVATTGAYTGNNTGVITIENTSSAQVIISIQAGAGQSQTSQYTVPAGYTAYLIRANISCEATKPATVTFWQRRTAQTVTAPYSAKRMIATWLSVTDSVARVFDSHISFPEKTDLWASATGNGAATAVEFAYDLILIRN